MIREYAALVKYYRIPYFIGLALMLAAQFWLLWNMVP